MLDIPPPPPKGGCGLVGALALIHTNWKLMNFSGMESVPSSVPKQNAAGPRRGRESIALEYQLVQLGVGLPIDRSMDVRSRDRWMDLTNNQWQLLAMGNY